MAKAWRIPYSQWLASDGRRRWYEILVVMRPSWWTQLILVSGMGHWREGQFQGLFGMINYWRTSQSWDFCGGGWTINIIPVATATDVSSTKGPMRKIEFGDHVQLMQGFYRIAIKHFAIPFRDRTFSQEYRLEHLERRHGHGEITSVMKQIQKCYHLNFQLSTFNFQLSTLQCSDCGICC